jgi:hypothetical protein
MIEGCMRAARRGCPRDHTGRLELALGEPGPLRVHDAVAGCETRDIRLYCFVADEVVASLSSGCGIRNTGLMRC